MVYSEVCLESMGHQLFTTVLVDICHCQSRVRSPYVSSIFLL